MGTNSDLSQSQHVIPLPIPTPEAVWRQAIGRQLQGPSPRCMCTMVEDAGKIILFGGGTLGKAFSDVYELDVEGPKHWMKLDTNGVPVKGLIGHTAVKHGRNMIVFGGMISSGQCNDLVYVLNLDTFEWKVMDPTGPSPGARKNHSAVIHDDKMLVLMGNREREVLFGDFFALDVGAGHWHLLEAGDEVIENKPCPRLGHSAVVRRDIMWVFGGQIAGDHIDNDDDDRIAASWSNDLFSYNLASKRWNKVEVNEAPIPAPRYGHASWGDSNTLYVFGGDSDNNTIYYESFTWREVFCGGDKPGERSGATVITVKSTVLLMGGEKPNLRRGMNRDPAYSTGLYMLPHLVNEHTTLMDHLLRFSIANGLHYKWEDRELPLSITEKLKDWSPLLGLPRRPGRIRSREEHLRTERSVRPRMPANPHWLLQSVPDNEFAQAFFQVQLMHSMDDQ